jgi:hypothetical protein
MATGRNVIAAIKKGTTWGTAVDVDEAAAGLLLTEVPDFLAKPEQLPDESAGFSYLEYIDAGNRVVQPTFNGYLRYTGALWRFVAAVIGDDSAAVVSGSDYDHTMDVQAETALFHTIAVYDGNVTKELPSFKTSGFNFTGESGDFWKFQFTGIGNNVVTTGQATASLNSPDANLQKTKTLRVPFGATRVRMLVVTGAEASLGASHIVYPNSIGINFQRVMVPEFLANAVAEGSGEFRTLEPQENGLPDLTVTLNFPEYPQTNYSTAHTDLNSESIIKMDITMQGTTMPSSSNLYTVTMSFPNLRVVDLTHGINGPARIPEQITLRATRAQSAPAGMSGITDLMRLVLRDQVSTGYDT